MCWTGFEPKPTEKRFFELILFIIKAIADHVVISEHISILFGRSSRDDILVRIYSKC